MKMKRWPSGLLVVILALLLTLNLSSNLWAQKAGEPPSTQEKSTPPPATAEEEEEEEEESPFSEEAVPLEIPKTPQSPGRESETAAPSPEPMAPPEPSFPWDEVQLAYARDLYDASSSYQSGLLPINLLTPPLRDPLLKYALTQIQAFLHDYPQSSLYPAAYILLGDAYLKNGEPQKATATFMVAMARFDQTPQGSVAKSRFEDALQKTDKEDRKNLSIIQSSFKSSPNQEEAHYAILKELNQAAVSGLYSWMAEEWGRFAHFYYTSERSSIALENMAQAYLKVPDPQGAVMAYKRVIHVHPHSPSAAAAYFALGDIWRNSIKQPGKAVTAYLDAAKQYPHDLRVEESLWKIVQVYQIDLKDYPKAVEAYQRLIDRFPDGVFTAKGLWEMASLYEELNRPLDAVKAYQRLQKDFPQNPQAPAALLKAGSLAEKELKDPGRAQGFYESVIREYPKSKESEDARKRIEKLKAKS